jgi:hypothetical protein
MATLTTPPPLVRPVNRLIGSLPPRGKPVSRPEPPQPTPKRLRASPVEHGPEAVVAPLVLAPLALVMVPLWPLVFGALVLLLVGLTPFVAIASGVRAILRHGRRVAEPPAEPLS